MNPEENIRVGEIFSEETEDNNSLLIMMMMILV